MSTLVTSPGGWHTTAFARHAETTAKIMACAALFCLFLPTAFPDTFLTLFLICSIAAGNYKFKLKLIIDNSVALLAIAVFLLLAVSLVYTTAPMDDAMDILGKHGKLLYIPLLLSAFHERHWQRRGLVAFLSGASLMMLLSYMTLSGWSWESVYQGHHILVLLNHPLVDYDVINYYQRHTVFRNTINHGIIMVYATYLFAHHALDEDRKILRVFFILFAVLGSYNILLMIASRTGQVLWVILSLLLVYQCWPDWKRMVTVLAISSLLLGTSLSFSEYTIQRWGGGAAVQLDIELIGQGDYQGSLGQRLIWLQAGWDIFKRHPVVGTGVGSYENESAKYFHRKITRNPEQDYKYYTHNPDNDYVSIGVQLGAVGLLLWIAWFIQQWRISHRLPPFSSYAAQGMIVVVVLNIFAHSFMYSRTRALFFVLLTALFFSAYLSNRRDDASS